MGELDLFVPVAFAVGTLLVITLASSIVAWRLLRWRMRYQSDGTKLVVIPEALMERLDRLLEREEAFVQKVIAANDQVNGSLAGLDASQKETYSRLLGHLSAIQGLAEDRLKEVDRLKEGYDYVRLKNLLRAVVRIIDDAESRIPEIESAQARNAVQGVRDELLILLENNGIEQFRPPLGLAYSAEAVEYKVVKRVPTNIAESALTIAELRKPGYRLAISDESFRIIREAEVVIFGKVVEGEKANG